MARRLSSASCWILLVALTMASAPAAGQTEQTAAAPQTAAAAGSPRSVPMVIGARSTRRSDPGRVALGESIILVMQGLKDYLGQDETMCESLVLFLDEVLIEGSHPEACDPYSGEVRFLLDRTDKSDAAWHTLLAEPVSFTKEISVSAGAKGNLSFSTKVKDFKLEILPALELYVFFAGLLAALLIGFRLARRTALLRDHDPSLAPGTQAPYSLSRFQLAFWTFLVISAYLFIWMITEELDTITGSILVLLGIGSGTALAAALIDQGKAQAAATDAATPAMTPPKGTPVSRGFLHDILSDANGISIHRFQLFAWTLVLGVIFCASVYKTLSMPQFSTTLLGLMGLSSGTYLGFKVPEQARRE